MPTEVVTPLDQLEAKGATEMVDEAAALADQHRVHGQAQFVEQPGLEQFGDDGDAVDGDVAALAGPQLTDEVEEVTLDDVAVLPLQRAGECAGGDVLGHRVDELIEAIAGVVRPVLGSLLVHDATEDDLGDRREDRAHHLAFLWAEESVLEVAGFLDDAVEGGEEVCGDLSHDGVLLVGVSAGCDACLSFSRSCRLPASSSASCFPPQAAAPPMR